MLRSALEVEYGLTDKIDFAYYLNLVHPNGQPLQYAGSKFRLRGTFSEKGVLPADLGWYAEVEWWQSRFNDDQVEIELMPTLQKDVGDWTFILNAPDIEKVLVGVNRAALFEISYRGEARYRLSEDMRLGLQFYGGFGQANNFTPLDQQQHYIFPVVHTLLPANIRASFALGFGLTPGSDLLLVKANFTFLSHEQQWD